MITDPRLNRCLDRWEELWEQGQNIPAEEICCEEGCPELGEELERRIRMLESMWQLMPGERISQGSGVPRMASEPTVTVAAPEDTAVVTSRYVDLKFHDRGGLGEVFVAAEVNLRRHVALKFMKASCAADAESRRQFLIEAEVTARLDHPGVVPVYGIANSVDGRPFYAMRFIQGRTLNEAIDRFHESANANGSSTLRRLDLQKLLNDFISVCRTIAYSHNRGIVHRDIKPQNILIGRYGEVMVADWGLALSIDRDDKARLSGEETLRPQNCDNGKDSSDSVVGTPSYMSPEQARGDTEISSASDIYSLGATLYKLLSGSSPFSGSRLREVLDKVGHGKFDPPRCVNDNVPPALQAVCLKAMQLDPNDRYKTALDLSKDLERWLADEPVSCYRESWSEWTTRWMRRHRTGTLATAATLLLITFATGIVALMFGTMAKRLEDAVRAEQHAREHSVRSAARFAATAVAGEVDRRWRILETEAADAELRNLLLDVANAPNSSLKPLQNWVDSRFIQHSATTNATSWFIRDEKGIALARSPYSDSAGRSFAYRDYFHGLGRDLTPQEAVDVSPIRFPYRSNVFVSRTTANPMVAFSVPIWADRFTPRAKVVGVLGMTVELGEFRIPSQGMLATLVDLRNDSEGHQGRVLQHPRLEQIEGTRDRTDSTVYLLAPSQVNQLFDIKDQRLRQSGAGEQIDNLLEDYQDPAGGIYSGRWLAGVEPVLINGRPKGINDTGWMVIVQDRHPDHATNGRSPFTR